MIPIKVYDNMNNSKFDNVNFEYGFEFYICMLSKKLISVIIQDVHLFMLSPFFPIIIMNFVIIFCDDIF
jgi:hypothetical protein